MRFRNQTVICNQSGGNGESLTRPENKPPVAVIGMDFRDHSDKNISIHTGEVIRVLKTSFSYDTDPYPFGGITHCKWQDENNMIFKESNDASCDLYNKRIDIAGVYDYTLTVSDNDGETDSSVVRITVTDNTLSGGGTSGGGTSGNETSGNGTSGNGTSGDGTSGDGTSGDGTSGDGTAGTVTKGDLMWEDTNHVRGGDNNVTWDQAVTYCTNLDLAGHTDWRLPHTEKSNSGNNEVETIRIAATADANNTIVEGFHPVYQSAMATTWTDELVEDPTTADKSYIVMIFQNGIKNRDSFLSTRSDVHVRCVRDAE